MTTRSNSIAFLRLALASAVIYGHSWVLGGWKVDPGNRATIGQLAVDGFFFLSGMLILKSYMRCASPGRYLWHRLLRIFPGFWVCLIVTAFVFAPIVALIEHASLHAPDSPQRYVLVNALLNMHQWSIAGLLARNPLPLRFDMSLWSLWPEFLCYLAVALFGILGVFNRSRWFLYGLFILLYLVSATNATGEIVMLGVHRIPLLGLALNYSIPQTFEYFTVGALVCLYRERIPLNPFAFALAALIVPIVSVTPWFNLVEPFAWSYVLLWLAYKLPLRNVDHIGDFSYGTYIYAFPVQQMLFLLGLNRFGFVPYLLLSVVVTAPLAALSWFLVERPSMAMKDAVLPTLRRAPAG